MNTTTEETRTIDTDAATAQATDQQPAVQAALDDELYIDEATGTVVGTVDPVLTGELDEDAANGILWRMRRRQARRVAAEQQLAQARAARDAAVAQIVAQFDATDAGRELRATIAQAERVAKHELQSLTWYMNMFAARLGDYAKRRLPKRSKSIDLLNGRVSLRTPAPSWNVGDVSVAYSWFVDQGIAPPFDLKFKPGLLNGDQVALLKSGELTEASTIEFSAPGDDEVVITFNLDGETALKWKPATAPVDAYDAEVNA
jgi:hypothetical protein